MANAWVLKTQECGIMGVYSSRRKAMIAAHEHLTQDDTTSIARTHLSDVDVNGLTLTGEYDIAQIKRFTINY